MNELNENESTEETIEVMDSTVDVPGPEITDDPHTMFEAYTDQEHELEEDKEITFQPSASTPQDILKVKNGSEHFKEGLVAQGESEKEDDNTGYKVILKMKKAYRVLSLKFLNFVYLMY